MKSINKMLAAAILIAIAGFVVLAFRDEGKQQRAHNPQKTVFVYELNPSVAVKANNFPALVRKFAGKGFQALKQTRDGGAIRFTSNDPSEFYEVNEAEGRFSFSKNLSRYMGNFKPSLPEPKAAQEIAKQFLTENKLMAENTAEMQLIHSGGLRSDDENGSVIDKMITLTYGRVIDGVPVIGKGSKIVVNVGDKGEVEGVIRNWKAYLSKRELKPAEIKTEAEMHREFEAMVIQQFGKNAKSEVKRSYMVYFDNTGKYLQPVMAYETTIILKEASGQTKELPYLGIIEAMQNPMEKLNLTGVDPAGLRIINGNNPDKRVQATDKGD